MEYEGTVRDGVVVFAGDIVPPEGTRVRVQLVAGEPPEQASPQTLGQRLMKFAGRARGLPPDAARNHDHYLYGTPKR